MPKMNISNTMKSTGTSWGMGNNWSITFPAEGEASSSTSPSMLPASLYDSQRGAFLHFFQLDIRIKIRLFQPKKKPTYVLKDTSNKKNCGNYVFACRSHTRERIQYELQREFWIKMKVWVLSWISWLLHLGSKFHTAAEVAKARNAYGGLIETIHSSKKSKTSSCSKAQLL